MVAISEKEISLTTVIDFNLKLIKPFRPPSGTLMRHCVDYEGVDIIVGSHNEHVCVLVPAAALDVLPGGLREMAVKDPEHFEDMK